jgi:hypothetical protein
MTKLMRTTRAGLMALGLLAGGSVAVGEAAAGQEVVSQTGSTSSPDAAEAARASCPSQRVCFWSASNFQGTRRVFRPVEYGTCLRIADVDSGMSSVVNNSFVPIRVWETAQETLDGTECHDRNGIVWPGQSRGRFSFGVAHALGSL